MNFYEVLGVKTDADQQDIRKAFRKKAKLFHPDINTTPEAGKHFQLAYIAYEILSDPEKRNLYNDLQYLKSKFENNNSTFNNWQTEAATQAEVYAEMDYNNFNKSFLAQFNYHSTHFIALMGFTFIFMMGVIGIVLSLQKINAELNAGIYSFTYILLAFSITIMAYSGKATKQILNLWMA